MRSSLLGWIRWAIFISKSQRSLCVLFFKTDSGMCIYHLLLWSNLNFLYNSQWITFPTQSCLVLYSFWANLQHSLIIIIIIIFLKDFSHQRQLMIFLWNLSDSKSSQISRTLLSILANLNNAVIWLVSTRPVISKSSSPCTNRKVTVPRAPIKVGITVTFMFHRFPKQGPSTYSSFHVLSSLFSGPLWQQSPQFYKVSFYVLVVDYYKVWSFGRD